MTDVSQHTSRRRKAKRRNGKPGFFYTLGAGWPIILSGLLIGLLIYNPSGYSIWHAIGPVFFDGVGQMTMPDGSPVPFYYQPIMWGFLLMLLIVGWVVYFKWESARNEKSYVYMYLALWIIINGIVIGLWMTLMGQQLLSARWVEWQIMPLLISSLSYGSYMPKIRRAYNTSGTIGSGSLDEIGDHHDHDDHDDDD